MEEGGEKLAFLGELQNDGILPRIKICGDAAADFSAARWASSYVV